MGTGAASCASGRDAPAIRDFNLASKKQALLGECEITHWPRPMGWQDAEKSCPGQLRGLQSEIPLRRLTDRNDGLEGFFRSLFTGCGKTRSQGCSGDFTSP